jgi:Bifunctional DNA primase/polymerase, N-terminal
VNSQDMCADSAEVNPNLDTAGIAAFVHERIAAGAKPAPSAYASTGSRLCEMGYAALPVAPRTKKPGDFRQGEWVGKSNWREEYSKRPPTALEQAAWAQWPGAGVCVVSGPASGHTVAIDIDVNDLAIKAAIESVIPPTTVRKRGMKGETLFFHGPTITESMSWNRGERPNQERLCDLIGPGRQTLLPPTLHPDTGQPYVWTGPDTLLDMRPDELPEITPEHITAIGEALRSFGWAPERVYSPLAAGSVPDTDNYFRQLNERALANLPAWVPDLGLVRLSTAVFAGTMPSRRPRTRWPGAILRTCGRPSTTIGGKVCTTA